MIIPLPVALIFTMLVCLISYLLGCWQARQVEIRALALVRENDVLRQHLAEARQQGLRFEAQGGNRERSAPHADVGEGVGRVTVRAE